MRDGSKLTASTSLEHIFQIRTIEEDCITGMALTGSLKGEYGEPDMKMIARVCSNKDLSSLKIVRDRGTGTATCRRSREIKSNQALFAIAGRVAILILIFTRIAFFTTMR